MSRRTRGRGRGRTDHLGRRQGVSLRFVAMAVVALGALLALGGPFAEGAAGCFSKVSEGPGPVLDSRFEAPEKTPEKISDRPPSFQVKIDP